MLDRAEFIKWDGDSTPQAKPQNMNTMLLLNVSPEYSNTFRRYFQESLKEFHPKAQVWKAKLKTFLDPSKVGFIICSANTLQVNLLVNNFLSVIKQEIGPDIEVEIQLEAEFLRNEDGREF